MFRGAGGGATCGNYHHASHEGAIRTACYNYHHAGRDGSFRATCISRRDPTCRASDNALRRSQAIVQV